MTVSNWKCSLLCSINPYGDNCIKLHLVESYSFHISIVTYWNGRRWKCDEIKMSLLHRRGCCGRLSLNVSPAFCVDVSVNRFAQRHFTFHLHATMRIILHIWSKSRLCYDWCWRKFEKTEEWLILINTRDSRLANLEPRILNRKSWFAKPDLWIPERESWILYRKIWTANPEL